MGIGSLLSGAAGIAGAVSGARSQDRAADTAEQGLALQTELGRRILDAQLADRIDAQGNAVVYNEEENVWEVIPAETTRQVLGAQQEEILRQLTEDAGRRRQDEMADFAARADARSGADTALTQLMGALQNPLDRSTVEGVLHAQAIQDIDDAFEDTRNAVTRQGLRSGTSSTGIITDLAREQAEATSKAGVDAAARSFGLTENINDARTGGPGRIFSALSQRASPRSVPVNFSSANENLSGQVGDMSRASIGAGQVGSSGLSSGTSQLGNIQMNQESAIPGILEGISGLATSLDLPSFFGGGQDRNLRNRQLGNR